MAVTFDGPNLTITLESGVTSLDWQDVYSDWKRWVNDGGGDPYAPAFRVVGGDPLSAVINAGTYYFLRNDLGWRIKPPEEDITVFVTGNLALEDVDKPSIIPTTGAFTAAVLGLQPVTQGVVPSMQSQLEVNVFQNAVCVSTSGSAGQGYVGLDPIGTRRAPSNNLDDAKAIADRYGIVTINFIGNYDTTTEATDFSAGYQFTSDSPLTAITLGSAANFSNCSFQNMKLSGQVDGVNSIRRCEIDGITGFTGEAFECDLVGSISMGTGFAHLRNCFSAVAGTGSPQLNNVGANEIIIRDLRGSISIGGMSGTTQCSIGVYGGRVIFQANCTGGAPSVRGSPYSVDDLSGNVNWADQTEGFKTTEIRDRLDLNSAKPNTYKDDGTQITSSDWTLTRTDNGNGTSTVARS